MLQQISSKRGTITTVPKCYSFKWVTLPKALFNVQIKQCAGENTTLQCSMSFNNKQHQQTMINSKSSAYDRSNKLDHNNELIFDLNNRQVIIKMLMAVDMVAIAITQHPPVDVTRLAR